MRDAGNGEDGTIMVLTIGLVVLLLALVTAVTDASAVFLARRDLAAACDEAAAAAAQAVDRTALYRADDLTRVPLDLDASRARVATWLAQQHEPGLQVEVTGLRENGTEAETACTRTVSPPLRAEVGLPEVTVGARSRADSPLTGPR